MNRRAGDRFALPLKGSAVFEVGSQDYQSEIKIRDISAYGAYFFVNFRPTVSAKLRVHLPIEDSNGPFEAAARAVRVEEGSEEGSFGIAVEFDEIPRLGE